MTSGRIGRELDREEEEQEAVGGQREGDRVAEEKEDHEGAEHDRREVLGEQVSHGQELRNEADAGGMRSADAIARRFTA